MITKLQIGQITFNDNDNYFVTGLSGLGMPPVRVANYNLAGEHYGVFVSAFYGKRAFSINGSVVGANVSDFLTKKSDLINALSIVAGEVDVQFTLSDGRAIQLSAITQNFDFDTTSETINSCNFQIQFESTYPFLTGQVDSFLNLKLAQGAGGEVPAPDMPMALEGDSGWKLDIANAGNAPYHPRIRIFGPVVNPAITNVTTGKQLRFVCTLTAGQYLDIDCRRKTVIDHTLTNRYSYKTGDWWFIQPGVNSISFTADAYDASAIVILYYRDAWLGI